MNDSRKVFSDGTVAGSYRTGFGIDCNGLITEAAYLAGLHGAALQGEGAGTGNLMDTGLAQNVSPKFARAGDYIVWRVPGEAHVVYVWQSETRTDEDGKVIYRTVRTVEANGSTKIDGRGRTRYDTRQGSDLRNDGAVTRRWKAQ